MQVKVGIWLTDMRCSGMGNLAFVPGSHRQQYFDAYDTDEAAPGEEQLLIRRGSLTLMDTALWHRTVANESTAARINLYLGYCPSWLPTSDRNQSSPAWLATLNREQRIIMRSYAQAFSHAKPPPEDVRLLHRKRTTVWERLRAKFGD